MKNELSIGLTVGIPTLGRPLCMEWANAWKSLSPPMNYNMRVVQEWNKPVAVARNSIAKAALEQDSKYIFFLGDDVVVPYHTLRQLIYKLEMNPQIGLVSGIYCSKTDPAYPLVFRGNGKGSYWNWKLGEFFEVTGVGMDCALIRTKIFKELSEPWFETVDDDDFLEGISNAESWTEDLFMCNKLLEETEWKIFADATVICEHWDAVSRTCWTLPHDSYPVQEVENPKKMLDLGCGPVHWHFEGEGRPLRVDIREEVEPDFRADIRNLPFASDSNSVVFSSHTLEHMGRHEVGKVLDEWIRVLEPGGELRLAVPNLEYAAEKIQEGVVNDTVLNVLYGAQTYDENYHKVGFTPKSLRKMLTDRGLIMLEEQVEGINIIIRAEKPVKDEGKPEEGQGVQVLDSDNKSTKAVRKKKRTTNKSRVKKETK